MTDTTDTSATLSLLSDLSQYGLLTDFLRAQAKNEILADISLTDSEKTKSIQHFARHHNILDSEGLNQHRVANCLTDNALSDLLLINGKEDKYIQSRISDSEVSHFFLNHLHRFTFCSYYLLSFVHRSHSLYAYLRIKEGESFYNVAHAPSAIGFDLVHFAVFQNVSLESVSPHPLTKYCSQNYLGRLIKPFFLEHQWHILQLYNFKEAILDAQTQSRIRRMIYDETLAKRANEKLGLIRDLFSTHYGDSTRRWLYHE